MGIKIAICDDEELIRKQICNYISAYYSSKKMLFQLYEFSSGIDLLQSSQRITFSFIFLDIDLGKYNGVDIAKSIRNIQLNPINIVFVTNYEEYQTKVFSIHTFDYILKPIKKETIYKVLDDLTFWYNKETKDSKERMTFKTIDGFITLYIEDILYFEYNNRRIDIVTKKATYHMYDKIKKISQRMEKYNFISPHAAYVINMKEISCYLKSSNQVIMTNEQSIPISQLRTKKFKEQYVNYINNMWEENHD